MGTAAVVGTVRIWIDREWALSAWGPTSTPESKARREVKVGWSIVVSISSLYGATRLQEVSYILAKISDVD